MTKTRTVIGVANLNEQSRFLARQREDRGKVGKGQNGKHKHLTHQLTKLAARRAAAPKSSPGFKLPGSMNPHKQG